MIVFRILTDYFIIFVPTIKAPLRSLRKTLYALLITSVDKNSRVSKQAVI
jgi:hypothetical protein